MTRLAVILLLATVVGCTPFLVRHPDMKDRIERLAPLIEALDKIETDDD